MKKLGVVAAQLRWYQIKCKQQGDQRPHWIFGGCPAHNLNMITFWCVKAEINMTIIINLYTFYEHMRYTPI